MLRNRSRGQHRAHSTRRRQPRPNSPHADRQTHRIIGHRMRETLAISLLCMDSRGHTTGPTGHAFGNSAGYPTRLPAGIRLRMPTASTRHTPPTSALCPTACTIPATRARDRARCHCPRCPKGNNGPHSSSSWRHAYAFPQCACPAPCGGRACRAADYACCIATTTTASAAACLAQIPHAPMMRSAASTWKTHPQIRMTGTAAAVASRTPATSTADASHAFNRSLHRPNCIRMRACQHSLPGLVQAPRPMLKALSWLARIGQIESLASLLSNPLARAFASPQQPQERKEALPLPLAILASWERKVCAADCTHNLRITLGSFLLAAHTSMRFGDIQRIKIKEISLTQHALRGSCWATKTTKLGQPPFSASQDACADWQLAARRTNVSHWFALPIQALNFDSFPFELTAS